MKNKMNKWLENPALFRYGFFILMLLNCFLYFNHFNQNHLYVFYILATIFLGIGFYNKPPLFLILLTTLVVISRYLHAPELTTLVSLFLLEATYIIIMFISVSLMKSNQKIKEDQLELILALSKALDSRDTYTSNHSTNVARYASEIAKKMKLPQNDIEIIYKGGILHDIGKIGIPENILLKPGSLTNDEYHIIKNHPSIGYEMIRHVSDFNETGVLDIVLYHHERYDGKGYPRGLSGTEIPLVARIMAIADSFDAMTSKRVYRNEIDLENTLIEIKKNKGTQFDPEITEVFLSLFNNDKENMAFINHLKTSEEYEIVKDLNIQVS
jgi:putative nucleotidyltransferase with HDIG domain